MSEKIAVQIALRADLARSDLVEGKVWFVNYAAIDPTAVKVEQLDLHGAGMLPKDVELFAHRWLAYSRSIDIEHDGVGRSVYVLESFFNGPDIQAAAWPINTHAVHFDVSASKEAMDGLRSGKLNSVSLDAYTFNKVMRLPVAAAKAALGQSAADWACPAAHETAKWAEELAREGYPGVTSVKQVGADLYLATRSCGLPVCVTMKNGGLESSTASGPWAHLAAAVLESPTLAHRAIGTSEANVPGIPNFSRGLLDLMKADGLIGQDLTPEAFSTLCARAGYNPSGEVQGTVRSAPKLIGSLGAS